MLIFERGYLEHYGRLGMKWGQHIYGRVDKRAKYSQKYDRPYSAEEVKKNYGEGVYARLAKDPAHNFRMETGIELIHREPSKEELDRIWSNWKRMTAEQKVISEKKSMELFGVLNEENYKQLIKTYDDSLKEDKDK